MRRGAALTLLVAIGGLAACGSEPPTIRVPLLESPIPVTLGNDTRWANGPGAITLFRGEVNGPEVPSLGGRGASFPPVSGRRDTPRVDPGMTAFPHFISRIIRRSRRHTYCHGAYGKATDRRERRFKPQVDFGIAALMASEALSAAACNDFVDRCA